MLSDRGTSHRGIGTPYLAAALLVAAGCGTEPRDESPNDFARPDSAPVTSRFVTSTGSAEATYHYRMGMAALDIERRGEARENFALAAQADPSFALAHLGLSLTATTPEAAARNLDLAARVAEGVTEGERFTIAITTEAWNRNLASRLDLAWRLADLHPAEPRAWRALAEARAEMNQIEASREALRRADELDPASTGTLIALARSYFLESPPDLERAVQFARRAANGTPEAPSLHVLLGDLLLVHSGIDEARESYERAAGLAPWNARAVARLGNAFALEGRYDSARAKFDAATALAEGRDRVTIEVSRALVHLYADEPQAAVEELFDVADAWEASSASQSEREAFQIQALTPAARIAMHHGLLTVAGRALERRARLLRRQAERVASNDFRRQQEADILHMNALLAAHRDDEEGARAEVERFGSLVEAQANPRKLEPAMEVLGLISWRAGELADAVSYFEQTDLRDPYNRWQLGRAHMAAGDAETAAVLFEDLARGDIEAVGFALVGLNAMRRGL